MLRRSLIAALSLAAIVLTGCTDAPRIPPADPTPTDAPLFSSDEEALAAATEVYEEYLAAADEFLKGETTDLSRLEQVVGDEFTEEAISGVVDFRELGWTASESRSLATVRLQTVEPSESGGQFVGLYVCEDLSGVDVVDSEGQSVVQDTREDLTPFEVGVEFESVDVGKVTTRDFWEGGGICP